MYSTYCAMLAFNDIEAHVHMSDNLLLHNFVFNYIVLQYNAVSRSVSFSCLLQYIQF